LPAKLSSRNLKDNEVKQGETTIRQHPWMPFSDYNLGVLMNQQTEKRLLLADTLPSFAAELRQLLIEKGEHDLTAQVSGSKILERCQCGDDFCATFCTQPKPEGSFGQGHRNVALTPKEGTLILDVVGEAIACVEVLYREDVRQKLDEVFPCRPK
jgi:hypothetical protein